MSVLQDNYIVRTTDAPANYQPAASYAEFAAQKTALASGSPTKPAATAPVAPTAVLAK